MSTKKEEQEKEAIREAVEYLRNNGVDVRYGSLYSNGGEVLILVLPGKLPMGITHENKRTEEDN